MGQNWNENKIERNTLLLSTSYFPCINYIKAIYNYDSFVIEQHESYIKQSYRNRTHITSSQGLQALSVPVVNEGSNEIIFSKKISYKEPWQQIHFKSIRNSYKNSPWFDFLEDELAVLFEKKHTFLIDLNTEILHWTLNLLKIKREICLTNKFELQPVHWEDKRNAFHPKSEVENLETLNSYSQIFKERNGFLPNLSILDLIFAEGIKLDDYFKA